MSGSEKPSFSGALAVGRELDLLLPDSFAVRDAYAQAEAESQPWLFNHVMRPGSMARSWHNVVWATREWLTIVESRRWPSAMSDYRGLGEPPPH
jgi:hypothetical protein